PLMTLEKLQTILVPQIEDALQEFMHTIDFRSSAELGQMLRYHMGWEDDSSAKASKGKRLRPLIVLLTTGAFGDSPARGMPAAVAVELLHNFTLIHDDIEDQSPMRHGHPTLWHKYGTAQAINAGDALFSIAQLSILDLAKTCNQYVVLEATRAFNQMCLHLTQGQYLDISFESRSDVTVEAYKDMIAGKTAALIAYTSGLGALISGQTATEFHKLSEFGEYLGLAFQIQDDILGIWGNPNITGKSAASDILTRKKTLPNLFGLAQCPEFRVLWEKETLTQDQVNQMAELLEQCGVREQVESEANSLTEQAFTALSSVFPEPNDYSKALFELAQMLLNRKV
ncbi:MAG: polyprenyl synthetase family protein, partial [Anaerolineaceae bacterium]|nr:polyprenyl synthetase family protein [Anaerolineaceae bacterium]